MSSIEYSCLVIPDAHVPFHNKNALALVKKVAAKAKPDIGVCIGDWADLYAINGHGLSATREANLEKELDVARTELAKVKKLFNKFFFVSGNHEHRYDRYIDEHAPKLVNVAPTIREALDIPKSAWTPYKQHLFIGKLGLTHDLGYSGTNALKQSLDAFGGNICIGHTHRLGVVYSGDVQGDRHVGLNVGWLGDATAADYMHTAQARHWQLGFGWVDFLKDGTCFAHAIPIVGNKCCVKGTVYTL